MNVIKPCISFLRLTMSLCLLLLSMGHLAAQTFKAQIEDVGGYYRLTYTVQSTDASHFTPPSLAAFEVLSGPSTSTMSNYQIINGHASHSETTSYTYILSAQKSGNITIGPASIQVNGRTIRSNAVSLKARVSSGSRSGNTSSQSQGGGYDDDAQQVQQAGSAVTQRDLFIDVTPSRTRVHEQEAVLLTYRIHARVGVALSNTSLMQKPDFKNIISQEIPIPGNQIQTTIEHRNGTTYRTGTILQYVVFPQNSGKITIPSITFNCAVIQQDRTMDLADAFFNGGGTIGVQVRRSTPVITLNVDALPQPKPANFSGAVGQYSIQGKLLNPKVATNDVATYRITLNGLGNLKLISAPKVSFPKDFDTYDAKTTDNTKVTANGLNGQLVFDYTFVPRNVGDYTIPATDFVFFDTQTNSYRTIHTEAISLHVEKGKRSNADVDKQLALLKSDIRALHAPHSTSIFAWGTWGYRLLCLFLILVMMVAYFVVNRIMAGRADVTGQRRKHAARKSLRRLQQAERILQGKQQGNFYSAVSQAITSYIVDTFNVGQCEITNERIRQLLEARTVTEEGIQRLLSLIDTCQYAQYAPNSEDNRQQVFNEASEVIELIDRSLKTKK